MLTLVLCAAALLLPAATRAYTYTERMDTKSGFCEGEGYERVAVGGVGFIDGRCEKMYCNYGERHVVGCGKVMPPSDPRCRLVAGTGNYPGCCETVKCGE